MVTINPAAQAFVSAVGAAGIGTLAQWLLGKRAARIKEKKIATDMILSAEGIEDDRLDAIASRSAELAVMERQRADRLETEYKGQLDNLQSQVNALQIQINERDSTINRQARKIDALEIRIAGLEAGKP